MDRLMTDRDRGGGAIETDRLKTDRDAGRQGDGQAEDA